MAAALSRAACTSSKKITAPLALFFSQRWNSSIVGTAKKPSHHNNHSHDQVYREPNDLVWSWTPPENPKEAWARIKKARLEYAKQVKEIRKGYILEMELQRQEKLRKDEARKEELKRLSEERKKIKAAAAEVRAAKHKAFQEELRQTVLKEKAEKLEYWKKRQSKREAKIVRKKNHIIRTSSMWIEEHELEKRLLNVIIDTTPL